MVKIDPSDYWQYAKVITEILMNKSNHRVQSETSPFRIEKQVFKKLTRLEYL
jgi:hypothetical protein